METGNFTKTALVTGAGQGIGQSIARTLAQKGMRIVLTGRNREKLEQVYRLLHGKNHEIIPVDLDETSEQDKLIKYMQTSKFPDIVIINHETRVKTENIENYCLNSQTDHNSSINWLKKIIPGTLASQRKNHFGRWIAISSIVNHTGGPGQSHYMLKKSILESMIRSIAVENGRYNITANIVSPGLILTEGLKDHYSKAAIDKLSKMNVMSRAGQPEEVSQAVAFLTDASYVTGVNLPVCGGFNLGWPLLKST